MRYHSTPPRKANMEKTHHTECGKGIKELKLIYTSSNNVNDKPLWKTVWQFLKKLTMHLSYGAFCS